MTLTEKRALAARLLRERTDREDSVHPLSHVQRSLWLHNRLAPCSAAYNIAYALRIRSECDTAALGRALQALTDRHATLRTSFFRESDAMFQRVRGDVPVDFQVATAQRWDDAKLRAEVEATVRQPFDLSKEPLFRARFWTQSSDDHILLLVAHHIVMDGWSLLLLLDELRLLYRAENEGSPIALPRAEAQYADFVRWQNELLRGPEGKRMREYWHSALEGELPQLELPCDKLRPAVPAFHGATSRFEVPRALHDDLKRLAKSQGATLYSTLLAAWFVLLHRHTGDQHIVVGSPVSGRSLPAFDRAVGCFINMVAIRVSLERDPTFEEVIQRTRQTVTAALAHGDYPFQLLVEELAPGRDASRPPVFQNSFVLQHLQYAPGLAEFFDRQAHNEAADFGGLTVYPFPIDQQEGQLDLTIELLETNSTLNGICRFNTDLFERDTVDRLLTHYRVLLEEAVANPSARIARMRVATDAELKQLLYDWPGGRADRSPLPFFPEIAAGYCRNTPDATALEFEGERISWREMGGQVGQLAAWLRENGTGRDTIVALFLDRSPRLIIAILAVMHAGGAYLALDPAYPEDRIAFMLTDSGASLVLTETPLSALLPGSAARPVLIDRLVLSGSYESLPGEMADDQLAYVIYTSGSTGRPKGVALNHRGLKNVVRAQRDVLGVKQGVRVLQFASPSFDASVFEIVMALAHGGTLVLARRESLLPGPGLTDFIRQSAISSLLLPPSTLAALPYAELPEMELLTVGGEECSRDLVERWAPGRRFFNLYGPSEVTIWATAARCFAGPDKRGFDKPSIGRPVTNVNVYLLDSEMQPVPCGVSGELWVGGPGIARGYLNRPELTAERFIADPFQPGGRLYRSGDLARWKPDGSIEYLGRTDDQIKLRGYRIELGEIEAVLSEHPGISDAAVIVRGAQLAAYVVLTEPPTELDSISALLRERLPEYMRPATLTALPALPLTPAGKINRRALPEPVAALEYTAPRNEREMQLCAIFRDVLQLRSCGVDDDFFALGGHSLNAMQLLARVRDMSGVELPLRALFENPTPAQLAASMAAETGQAGTLPPLAPSSSAQQPALSFAQERLWFLHLLHPESPAFNIPAGLRIRGVLDTAATEQALARIAARHAVLRTSFQTIDGRPFPSVEELQAVRFRSIPAADDLARVAEQEALTPFDLSFGSPMRACLAPLKPDEHVLLVTVHHIASDGWSTGLFLREFAILYQAIHSGHDPLLPPLPIQYSDYALWQRSWLSGDLLATQLAFWKQQLAGLAAEELLPNRPRTSTFSARAGVWSFGLDRDLTARARDFSRASGVTLYMTLLAAFHAVLARYTGSEDVVCGSPVANRNHTGTEAVIGFFVNMVVMRGDLSGDPSFRELVAREKAAVLAAFAHQDVPFEILVDALHPKRDLSRSPIFQITFALHNAPMEIPRITGLELEAFEGVPRTARYEVEFHLSESGGAIEAFALYRTDLFDEPFVGAFADAFRTLLDAALAQPDQSVSSLDMVPRQARELLLAAGNALHPLPEFGNACLHRLIEASAARNPRAYAVHYENQAITYAELDARANQLGNLLVERGIVPGSLVGLFMERSADLICAMLGILKAGAAYVPLDPAYPGERLAFIIHDAGIGTVVTQEALLGRLPESAETICFDRDSGLIAERSFERPDAKVHPHHPAYVIYTSGSTGQPKGVPVTHANVTRIFGATQQSFHFDEHDVWTMFHSSAFDFSVWEIWGALVHGARLVVVPYVTSRSPEAFLKLVLDEGVTVLNQTPSAFRQFQHAVLAASPANLPLRIVIFGGEALDFRGLASWFQKFGDRNPLLFNMYGITETTIHVTVRPVHANDALSGSSLIGLPLPDLRLYILDANRRLVPPGVPGEIFVGGAGVAQGYLNRPELTQDKFVPSPFLHGEILYRSGDRARFADTHDIEYLGRLDHQIQLHGFRIELGEVEAALESSPAVRDAVARLIDDRIVAWIVPAAGRNVNVSELRAHVRQRLPEYMLPSLLTPIEALPLNANGKIEYRDLPSPTSERPQLDVEFVAPRREEEKILTGIWADVLGIERPGVHDNFFELGGDSILSIQIVSKAAAAGVRVTPKQVFQYQTIAELAAVAAPLQAAADSATQGPVTGEYPLTRIQRWFFSLGLAKPEQWNQSVVLSFNTPVDNKILEVACRRLLAHHDVLRTRFQNGKALIVEPDGGSCFSFFDFSVDSEPDFRVREQAEAIQSTLHLERGPLIRFARFHTGGAEPDRLLIVAHHLVMDGVSWRILLEDLAALVGGRDLPRKTASFSEWAVSAGAQTPEAQTNDAGPPILRERDRAANTESTASIVSLALNVQETRDLLTRFPMITGCRTDEALLAAVAGTLGSVVVNLENHGRGSTDLDVSRTVGWFTEMRTLEISVPADLSPDRLLPDRLLEVVRNQAEGNSKPTAAPWVSVNYLGQFDRALAPGSPLSLTVERLGSERAPDNLRPHEIDISAGVFEGQLKIDWVYSSALCEAAAAELDAQRFLTALRALIEHHVRRGVPPEASDIYPLAPQQQGMLLESLVGSSPGVHVEQLTCLLEGTLEPDRFRAAWANVIARHSILRTCFSWSGRTRPVQVVYDSVEVPMQTGLWESDDVQTYLDAERRRGFQLDRAPLMRLGLFRLNERSHRFVWTQHHTILDGWCQPLVLGEVLRTYRDGRIAERAPDYRQYVDYIGRQDQSAHESFWRLQLEGFRASTPPGRVSERSENVSSSEAYDAAEVSLDGAWTAKLEAAARAGHVSLGTILAGAWALLIARYSGAEDVLFGLTVSGRPTDLEGSGKMVGLLANTLPFRVQIDWDRDFWPWISELGQSQAEIRMFETSRADLIRRVSEVPTGMPLHDSVLAFENYPLEALSANTNDLEFTIQNVAFQGARTHQAVAIIAVPGQELSLRFVFDLRRVDPGSTADDFRHVLEAIACSSQSTRLNEISSGLDAARFPRYFPLAGKSLHPARSRAGATPRHPLTSVQRRLTELWCGLLNVPSIGIDENFFDAGGHSLIAIDLLTRIRTEFGRELPLSAILEAPTISALAYLLEDSSEYRRGPLISFGGDGFGGNGARRPVFFMPGAGGNVLYFDAMARLLGPDQPFFAIEARGLDGREDILENVESVAAYNVEALRRRFPEGPYLLGGHSFGCMVALEMSLQLQRQGETVEKLFILDDMAPVPGRIAPDDLHEDVDAVWLYKILRLAERLQRRTMDLHIADLIGRDSEAQLDLAMQKLKEIGYLPDRTERAAAHRYVEIFKANFRASFRYVAPEQFTGSVILFRARDQQAQDPIVAYSKNFIDDPKWGWGAVCDRVAVEWIPGDHISMMAEPHVSELAKRMSNYL